MSSPHSADSFFLWAPLMRALKEIYDAGVSFLCFFFLSGPDQGDADPLFGPVSNSSAVDLRRGLIPP